MFKKKKKQIDRLKASFGKRKAEYFDFKSIERYFRDKNNSQAFQVLSDKTCNDLDFQELFMFLDRTTSKVGQQYLYTSLRTISPNTENTALNEELVTTLTEDSELRISIQRQLEKLQKQEVYYLASLFQKEHPKPPKWFFVLKLLNFTSVLSFVLFFFDPQFLLVLIAVFAINFIIHIWNKKNIDQSLSALPQLLLLNNVAAHLHTIKTLKRINPKLSTAIKTINRIKTRMSFFKLETKLQGEFESIAWMLLELVKILFLLEPLLFFGVLKRVATKRDEIEAVFEFIGRVDMLIAIASVRAGVETFCIPKVTGQHLFNANAIYHPLLTNCVPNTIEIADKSVLLTGSNMAGKTSFIRTIGLNVITGLTLNTCFAKAFSFPLVRVFSAIRISDDLMNNKSYYFEEVLTIKQMIAESENEKKNLFLLDEIFKGTNTIERISAGKAVLSSLAKNGNFVFVATHDIELTTLLSAEYDLYHFSEKVAEKTVDFDYKLKAGQLTSRNAIRILQINDYPEKIVCEAMTLARKLDEKSNTP